MTEYIPLEPTAQENNDLLPAIDKISFLYEAVGLECEEQEDMPINENLYFIK